MFKHKLRLLSGDKICSFKILYIFQISVSLTAKPPLSEDKIHLHWLQYRKIADIHLINCLPVDFAGIFAKTKPVTWRLRNGPEQYLFGIQNYICPLLFTKSGIFSTIFYELCDRKQDLHLMCSHHIPIEISWVLQEWCFRSSLLTFVP